MKSPITTHVLDTSLGRPATGIPVTLEKEQNGQWQSVGKGLTDSDGRVSQLLPANPPLSQGTYRISFDLMNYFANQGRTTFYPYATITFIVDNANQHYHVPLLLSGFGFSTYRGS